jgi:transcriptional regulator with XRE-family HTH domain
MNSKFGHRIRLLRTKQKLLLRELAAFLEMDTAQLSKIERGERLARKDTVLKTAQILNVNSDELVTLWLADQICEIVKDEKNALLAMMVAEESVKYSKND